MTHASKRTPRVILEPLIENGQVKKPEAIALILKWYQDYKHLLFDDYYPTETSEYVRHLLDDIFELESDLWLILADGEMAGLVYLNDWYGDGAQKHSCQLHGILDGKFHRQGIGTLVGRKILHRLFSEMKVFRVEGWIDPDNTAMRALAEKLGFQLEGTVRGRKRVMGKPRDELVYGILRPDYFRHQKQKDMQKQQQKQMRKGVHSHEQKKEKRQRRLSRRAATGQ